jgi:hypothetical protein
VKFLQQQLLNCLLAMTGGLGMNPHDCGMPAQCIADETVYEEMEEEDTVLCRPIITSGMESIEDFIDESPSLSHNAIAIVRGWGEGAIYRTFMCVGHFDSGSVLVDGDGRSYGVAGVSSSFLDVIASFG